MCLTGGNDQFRMEMLEEEKKKQLVDNFNQYNHLLGNFINKMEVKSDTSEDMDKKHQEELANHKQMCLLKVKFIVSPEIFHLQEVFFRR